MTNDNKNVNQKPINKDKGKYEDVILTLACNDAYTEYAMVVIFSIYENRNPHRTYEIKLFANGITDENTKRIKNLTSHNFNVQIYDVTKELQSLTSQGLLPHISIDTYIRFFIIDRLQEYNRILYLDIDMIVCSDVGELFDLDLKNKAIGASTDTPLVKGYADDDTLNFAGHNIKFREYFDNTLKLTKPDNYFQAGTLLIDVPKTIEKLPLYKALNLIEKQFILADQDILNYVFNDDMLLIDKSWNAIAKQSKRSYKDYKIMHFAGPTKPWRKPKTRFANVWWSYAIQLNKITPLHDLKFPLRFTTFKIPYAIVLKIHSLLAK